MVLPILSSFSNLFIWFGSFNFWFWISFYFWIKRKGKKRKKVSGMKNVWWGLRNEYLSFFVASVRGERKGEVCLGHMRELEEQSVGPKQYCFTHTARVHVAPSCWLPPSQTQFSPGKSFFGWFSFSFNLTLIFILRFSLTSSTL